MLYKVQACVLCTSVCHFINICCFFLFIFHFQICKDKMQAETWFCRLESYNIQDSPSQNGLDPLKSSRCAHSCVSSWKKQNLGLPAMTIRPSQVLHICLCFIKFPVPNLVINWLTNCYYSLYAIFFHLGMSFDSVSSWQHEFTPKVSVSSTQSSTCLWSGEFGAEFVTRLFENLWWTNRKVKNYWR